MEGRRGVSSSLVQNAPGESGLYLPMSKTYEADSLLAHYSNRKCNAIVEETYHAFLRAIDKYGTLSAEEIAAIGLSLFMNVTIQPLERMSSDPQGLRQEMAQWMAKCIETANDNGVFN